MSQLGLACFSPSTCPDPSIHTTLLLQERASRSATAGPPSKSRDQVLTELWDNYLGPVRNPVHEHLQRQQERLDRRLQQQRDAAAGVLTESTQEDDASSSDSETESESEDQTVSAWALVEAANAEGRVQLVHDLTDHGQQAVVARGGKVRR